MRFRFFKRMLLIQSNKLNMNTQKSYLMFGLVGATIGVALNYCNSVVDTMYENVSLHPQTESIHKYPNILSQLIALQHYRSINEKRFVSLVENTDRFLHYLYECELDTKKYNKVDDRRVLYILYKQCNDDLDGFYEAAKNASAREQAQAHTIYMVLFDELVELWSRSMLITS